MSSLYINVLTFHKCPPSTALVPDHEYNPRSPLFIPASHMSVPGISEWTRLDLQVYMFVFCFPLNPEFRLKARVRANGASGAGLEFTAERERASEDAFGSSSQTKERKEKQCFHNSSVKHVGMTYLFHSDHLWMEHKLTGGGAIITL